MKKTLGAAQVAAENSPNQESKPQEPDVSVSAAPVAGESARAARLPIDLSAIDPGKIAMAEKFGIPIGQILSWMQSVEERFNTIEEVLPKKVGEELSKAIDKARSEQAARQPPPNFDVPQQQAAPSLPGGMAGILSLLPQLMQSQPQDDLLSQLAKKALTKQIDMAEAITNAVVSKIASRATDAVADAVT